jgi:tetratricopeptide (TPR) repeat protein
VAVWQASLARADRQRAEKAENDWIEAAARLKKEEDERLAERRQYALDRAIEAAFGGDLEKARKVILAAQKAGVEAHQVYWLNGLVHYQRGKYEEAIKEFEASLELKRTAAALGMLARARLAAILFTTENFEGVEKASAQLHSVTPVTPEDYMCRGLGTSSFNSAQSIADLDRAIELRDTPLAHAFRAYALDLIALNTRDPKLRLTLCERALADIREAKKRLPDIPYVRYVSCHVHVSAAGFYRDTNQFEKHLEEAEQDAQALEVQPIADYVMARVRYFNAAGKEDAALEILKQASQREETKMLATRYAQALCQHNRVEDALKVLDGPPQLKTRPAQILRILLLAEVHGRDEAYQALQKLASSDPDILQLTPLVPQPLLFLGKRAEAAKLPFVDYRGFGGAPHAKRPLAEYIAGKISEEEMLKPWEGLPRSMGECVGHFWVGLVRLSEGDREGARELFEKCVTTHWAGLPIYPYAQIFLARMKNDPKWPRWIEPKK